MNIFSEDIGLDLLFSNLNMINMDVQPSVVRLTETDKSGLVMKKNVVTQAKLENNVKKFFSALMDVQP